jgi:hypothetical protein
LQPTVPERAKYEGVVDPNGRYAGRLAARDGATVDAVLARELRDLVSVHETWLSGEVPGFAEALAWPEVPLGPRRSGGGGW